MKTTPQSRCHWCRKEIGWWRVTVPRKAGDLSFDSWVCQEMWREGARVDALLLEE